MKALLKHILMWAGILASLLVFGILFMLVEPFGFLGEIVLVIVILAVPLYILETKRERGQLKGWFDTPSPLPSFANGFPVTIDTEFPRFRRHQE